MRPIVRPKKIYISRDIFNKMSSSDILKFFPVKLYKYFVINENTINTLKYSNLWYSSPKYFNDPFDCKINVNFGNNKKDILQNIETSLNDESLSKFFKNYLLKNINKKKDCNFWLNQTFNYFFDKNVGICCFSQFPDIPLMWSNYANSHTGICMIFETKYFINKKNIDDKYLLSVDYYKSYPTLNLCKYKNNKFKRILLAMLLAKYEDWSYECEWRSIILEGGNRLYPFPKKMLKGIIFGINTTDKTKKIIKDIIKKRYYDIIYYQAKMSNTAYKIIIHKEKCNGT